MTTDSLPSVSNIKIPSQLPEILKNYAKFIIKTNPNDIIAASAEYFQDLNKEASTEFNGNREGDQDREMVVEDVESGNSIEQSELKLVEVVDHQPNSMVEEMASGNSMVEEISSANNTEQVNFEDDQQEMLVENVEIEEMVVVNEVETIGEMESGIEMVEPEMKIVNEIVEPEMKRMDENEPEMGRMDENEPEMQSANEQIKDQQQGMVIEEPETSLESEMELVDESINKSILSTASDMQDSTNDADLVIDQPNTQEEQMVEDKSLVVELDVAQNVEMTENILEQTSAPADLEQSTPIDSASISNENTSNLIEFKDPNTTEPEPHNSNTEVGIEASVLEYEQMENEPLVFDLSSQE